MENKYKTQRASFSPSNYPSDVDPFVQTFSSSAYSMSAVHLHRLETIREKQRKNNQSINFRNACMEYGFAFIRMR